MLYEVITELALLALQGPDAGRQLARLLGGTLPPVLADLPSYNFV